MLARPRETPYSLLVARVERNGEPGPVRTRRGGASSKSTKSSTTDAETALVPVEPSTAPPPPSTLFARHRPSAASPEEAEAAYIAARDSWTSAMRAANSGRSADLASLALAQEAYEAATTERQHWLGTEASPHRAIPIEPTKSTRGIEIVVGQEARVAPGQGARAGRWRARAHEAALRRLITRPRRHRGDAAARGRRRGRPPVRRCASSPARPGTP